MYIPPITIGDTFSFPVKSFTDFNGRMISKPDWNLTASFRGNGVNLDVTGDSDWNINLTKANTDALVAGWCSYQIYATKGVTTERVVIDSGRVQVLANFKIATGSFNDKSQNRQDLEAVQAAMRAIVAGGAVVEYSIAGRSLKKLDMSELIMLEKRLILRVKQEQQAQDIKDGRPNGRVSYVRFK